MKQQRILCDDNDYEDYHRILIIPTEEELKSDKYYFPKKNHSDAFPQQLDTQFRLLRFDMLAPLRRSLRLFQDSLAKKRVPCKETCVRVKGEDADIAIFQGVAVVGVEHSAKFQCCLKLEVTIQPYVIFFLYCVSLLGFSD
jgi:hypothetical protein